MKQIIIFIACISIIPSCLGLLASLVWNIMAFFCKEEPFFNLPLVKMFTDNFFNFLIVIFLEYLIIETDPD